MVEIKEPMNKSPIPVVPLEKAWSEEARMAAIEARAAKKEAAKVPEKKFTFTDAEDKAVAKLPEDHPDRKAYIRQANHQADLWQKDADNVNWKNDYSRPSSGGKFGDYERRQAAIFREKADAMSKKGK